MNPTSFKRSSMAPDVDGDVGHCLVDPGDALGRGDQRDELQPGYAGGLEDLAGPHGRSAGGQHRVDQERQGDPRPSGKLVVILGRPQRRLVAVEPDVPDLGLGDQVEDAVGHAETGPQDRHDADDVRQVPRRRGSQRRGDLAGDGVQVGHGLLAQQHGQRADDLPELRRGRPDVPEPGELVLHDGMGGNDDLRHGSLLIVTIPDQLGKRRGHRTRAVTHREESSRFSADGSGQACHPVSPCRETPIYSTLGIAIRRGCASLVVGRCLEGPRDQVCDAERR